MNEMGKFTFIGAVVAIVVILGGVDGRAQDSKQKAMPGIRHLLLASQPNIVFVTSSVFKPNFGSLAVADQACQAHAEFAHLPKNTYKAWLSTTTVNAIDRLGTARGWVRVDGKPFADTTDDIAAQKIYYPIRVDENGNFDNSAGGSPVWTGTWNNGTLHPSGNCLDWTSASNADQGVNGRDDAIAGTLSSSGNSACDSSYRLYCFGVDRKVPVSVKPATGRIAFVTMQFWGPNTAGLADADQLCTDEAAYANLSGTFKAMLATDGASAASRFNMNGLPWVRPDGVPIASTAAELFSADFLNSAINLTADGQEYLANSGVWTGANSPSTAGDPGTTCKNWTSNLDTDWAETGSAGFTHVNSFFAGGFNKCNGGVIHLYCLQE